MTRAPNFFSNHDKEKFESDLSKRNYAFGFELGTNLNEEVMISQILPESPLWYSKKLEKGDVIVALKIPRQETLDMTFSDLFKLDEVLQDLEKDQIELTVRKTNGDINTITVQKGVFDTKQNRSAAFMLFGDKKVGCIWFSQFYTEFGPSGNAGCSGDVLREIVKLREEGAEGLIFDLRNNPGGSEFEALKIAGFLIGTAPLLCW